MWKFHKSPLGAAVGQGNLTLVKLLVSPGTDVQVNYPRIMHQGKSCRSKEYVNIIKFNHSPLCRAEMRLAYL